MARISYDDLNSGINAPTGDAATDMANAAANAFCDAFNAAPGGFLAFPPTHAPFAATSDLVRKMCEPRDKMPPPPEKPFDGGQCPCILYRVNYTAYRDGTVWYATYADLFGPISGLSLGNQGELKTIGLFYGSAACGGRQRFNLIANFENYGMQVGAFFAEINSVAPTDGSGDLCGNPPPQYPPAVPDLGDLISSPTIVLGGEPVVTPVKIPPVRLPVGSPLFPLINVNVGGIDINFDLGGVDINISPDIQPPDILPNPNFPPGYNLPPYTPPAPTPDLAPITDKLNDIEDSLDDSNGKLDDIKDKLDELDDCDRCEPTVDITFTSYPSTNSRVVSSLRKPLWKVKVTVTTQPINAKKEPGMSAPDVLYAGWFWFVTDGHQHTREPLDCATKMFVAPVGANGFAYTCRVGFEASAEAIMREEIPPEDT